jgi:hypothetical protein
MPERRFDVAAVAPLIAVVIAPAAPDHPSLPAAL